MGIKKIIVPSFEILGSNLNALIINVLSQSYKTLTFLEFFFLDTKKQTLYFRSSFVFVFLQLFRINLNKQYLNIVMLFSLIL